MRNFLNITRRLKYWKCSEEIFLQSFIPYSFIRLSRLCFVGALTKLRSQNNVKSESCKTFRRFLEQKMRDSLSFDDLRPSLHVSVLYNHQLWASTHGEDKTLSWASMANDYLLNHQATAFNSIQTWTWKFESIIRPLILLALWSQTEQELIVWSASYRWTKKVLFYCWKEWDPWGLRFRFCI